MQCTQAHYQLPSRVDDFSLSLVNWTVTGLFCKITYQASLGIKLARSQESIRQ